MFASFRKSAFKLQRRHAVKLVKCMHNDNEDRRRQAPSPNKRIRD